MTSLEAKLSKLVSFQSVTKEPAESGKLLDWAEQKLKPIFFVRRVRHGGYPALIATTRRTKTPKVMLAAHVDVVPASAGMFTMRARGGNLIGRGVADMKFGLACYLHLVERLGKKLKDLDLGIMLTSDEEIGGMNGTGFLVGEGYVPQVLFLPDGGHHWTIQRASKGVCQLDVTVRGATAHGSRPWEGHDPSWDLFSFLEEVRALFPAEPCGDAEHYHDSLTVGKLAGGKAVNQVPESAGASLDIRYTPETDRKKLLRDINALAKKNSRISVKEVIHGAAHRVDTAAPAIRLWQRIAKDMHGVETSFISSHGSSDARFFSGKKTVSLLSRPESGGLHTEHEWMSRKGLQRFYDVFEAWVQETAQ